jgi:transcriptional adapter 3
MPPGNSSQGTGKKGSAAMARQRSRNTTPSIASPTATLPPIEEIDTEYLDLKFELFRNITLEDLIDPGSSASTLPDSKNLDGIISRLNRLQDIVEKRNQVCDKGMRMLAKYRKQLAESLSAERAREEERLRREAEEEEREKRVNKKKRKATENLAPQETSRGEPSLSSSPRFIVRVWL